MADGFLGTVDDLMTHDGVAHRFDAYTAALRFAEREAASQDDPERAARLAGQLAVLNDLRVVLFGGR